MHKLFIIMLLCCSAIFAQEPMTKEASEALKAKVKAVAKQTKTIASDFTQYKHMSFLSEPIVTKGKLAFKAPELVKWAYKDPFEYSVIFKKGMLYINDEGNKSNVDIGSSKMFKQLNRLIVSSVNGDMFDEQTFNITYYKEKDNAQVHFVPKDEKLKKYIAAFEITFNKKGEVATVKTIEPSEDYTLIKFSNRKTNIVLSDEVFKH